MTRRTIAERWACAALLALLLGGCGDAREAFVAGRVQDACDGVWPACGEVVGCLLGPESYTEGRWPGRSGVLVRTSGPARLRVQVHVLEASAAGEQTVLLVHEAGCQGRVRLEAGGRALLEEAERQGAYVRTALVTTEGDHLVELLSDAHARYLLRVDVEPLEPR